MLTIAPDNPKYQLRRRFDDAPVHPGDVLTHIATGRTATYKGPLSFPDMFGDGRTFSGRIVMQDGDNETQPLTREYGVYYKEV